MTTCVGRSCLVVLLETQTNPGVSNFDRQTILIFLAGIANASIEFCVRLLGHWPSAWALGIVIALFQIYCQTRCPSRFRPAKDIALAFALSQFDLLSWSGSYCIAMLLYGYMSWHLIPHIWSWPSAESMTVDQVHSRLPCG